MAAAAGRVATAALHDLVRPRVVTFPSPDAFTAYRADPALAALALLREASVLHTEILTGEEGPHYG